MTGRAQRRRRLGRDFWLYFTGQLVSQVGSSFTLFALPLLVFKLTGSATNLAITTISEFLPYLLFGLLLGAVVDRVDRRRMMVRVELARAAVITTLPALFVAGHLPVAAIYAVGIVQATFGILFVAGEFTAVPALVDGDDLVAANARVMATNFTGQVVGPMLAGALVAVMPVADLLFVDAGTFLLSAATLAVIRRSFDGSARESAGAGRRGLWADAAAGLAYVWRHPVLRTVSIMMALVNLVGTTTGTQLVLFAKHLFSASDSEVAWLFAAGAAGVVAVTSLAGPLRRRLPWAATTLGALAASGLATTGMALVGSYAGALVLWALASGFGLLINVNTASLRQAIVPTHLYGRVISVAGVLAWSAIPVGALAGAQVIKAVGVAAVYGGIGVVTVGIAAGFAFSPLRRADRYLAEAGEHRPAAA